MVSEAKYTWLKEKPQGRKQNPRLFAFASLGVQRSKEAEDSAQPGEVSSDLQLPIYYAQEYHFLQWSPSRGKDTNLQQ